MKLIHLPLMGVCVLLVLRLAAEFTPAATTSAGAVALPAELAENSSGESDPTEDRSLQNVDAADDAEFSNAATGHPAVGSVASAEVPNVRTPGSVPHNGYNAAAPNASVSDTAASADRHERLQPVPRLQPRPETTMDPDRSQLAAPALVEHLRHDAPAHPQMITPGNFVYRGAFRMPHVQQNGTTFSYGGWALAWNPDGDADGPEDGFPGSLFMLGHENQQMVAEITIPQPKITHTTSLDDLPVAAILQPFADCTGGMIQRMNVDAATPFQIGGLLVKDRKLHWTMYKYYNIEGENFSSHGRCSLDLSNVQAEGLWHLGSAGSRSPEWHSYKHAGYILDVPSSIASQWMNGFDVISGLQISTGLQRSSQGPAMFVYSLPPAGTLPDTEIDAIPLTWYSEQAPLSGHHPSDRWTGGAWLQLGSKEAIVIFGRKSLGGFYYGDARPGDCTQDKGYHGTPYEAQVLFYSPASLIHVAQGQLKAHALEPWYRWSGQSPGGGLSRYLFPTCTQHLGGVAYDRRSNLLYVVQIAAGTTSDNPFEPLPVVHVFQIQE